MADQTRTLTCVQCPRGCRLTVTLAADGSVATVAGNGCDLGPVWARQEVEDPVRTLTTTVRVDGSAEELVSVRTARPIPRRVLGAAMAAVRDLRVAAPVVSGQVLVDDLVGTGVDLVATRGVGR